MKMFVLDYVVDENVIEEEWERFFGICFHKVIQEALKNRWRIIEIKWHDEELIMAFMSLECSLGNAYLLHVYLVIAQVEVHLCK